MAITDVPEFAHLTDADVENLARELDAIRQDVEAIRGGAQVIVANASYESLYRCTQPTSGARRASPQSKTKHAHARVSGSGNGDAGNGVSAASHVASSGARIVIFGSAPRPKYAGTERARQHHHTSSGA